VENCAVSYSYFLIFTQIVIIKVIKLREIKWVGHLALMREMMKIETKQVLAKLKGRKHL
jgi:hypothetical protein